MKVSIEIIVLGKVQSTWEKDGKILEIPKLNYSQDDGQIVGQLKVPAEVYNSVEVAKKYVLEATYGVGKNGGYLTVIGLNGNVKGGQV